MIVGEEKWVRMENIYYSLTHSSQLDIKMRTQTYAPDYLEGKTKYHIKSDKKTRTPTHGLRVAGAVIKNNKDNVALKLHKTQIKDEELPQLFKKFLISNDTKESNK